MPVVDMKKTGKRIKCLRTAAGLTVKDVQKACYLGSAYSIYKWQNGKAMPTLDNLIVLADLFKVSIDQIVIVKR